MDHTWLALPPAEGAHRLALEYLKEATRARARLEDPDDVEALHDFRVALRRLRSCERAYRKWLDASFGKRAVKELKRLAGATNPGRDSEVQLEWLARQADAFDSEQTVGLRWLETRLRKRCEEAYGGIREWLISEFDLFEAQLRKRLTGACGKLDKGAGKPSKLTFGRVSARLVRQAAAELHEHLELIGSADDEEEAHQARIRGKRLRYLLEPFRAIDPKAGEAVALCKRLQDILGDLHDAHVLISEVRETVVTTSASKALHILELRLLDNPDPDSLREQHEWPEYPGLMRAARVARQQCDRLFDDLVWEFLSRQGHVLFERGEEVATTLKRGASPFPEAAEEATEEATGQPPNQTPEG